MRSSACAAGGQHQHGRRGRRRGPSGPATRRPRPASSRRAPEDRTPAEPISRRAAAASGGDGDAEAARGPGIPSSRSRMRSSSSTTRRWRAGDPGSRSRAAPRPAAAPSAAGQRPRGSAARRRRRRARRCGRRGRSSVRRRSDTSLLEGAARRRSGRRGGGGRHSPGRLFGQTGAFEVAQGAAGALLGQAGQPGQLLHAEARAAA